MRQIKLEIDEASKDFLKREIASLTNAAKEANKALENGTGKGKDFLGWLKLPSSTTDTDIDEITETADYLRNHCEVVVVIGIGGSYLGAKAVIEAISGYFDNLKNKKPLIAYAGHHLDGDYLYELSGFLSGKSFGIINISKSGTTTEPALAFRFLKKQLENAVGKEEARKRIVAITDAKEGALRKLAKEEKYKTFVIPDNVGGRFSVLTPVGLLPIAVAGIDIKKLVAGALFMEKVTAPGVPYEINIAEQYAVLRNALYKVGKKIEILANFTPKLHYVAEWWKQLYGESEGKEKRGIFNAAVDFTTDLHSMGQWIQQGERSIFETVISIEKPRYKLAIPADEQDLDKLNYIAGKEVSFINEMAEKGTRTAHIAGGVPNLKITIPELNEYFLGQLLYFFEKACGISGYILGVNPFDQPGVEAYKKEMFALLGKPE
jgi:glucose-6-phosphate isomerase